MRRVAKWLGMALLLVMAGTAALAINVVWFKPFSIDIFFERAFIEVALQDPELLSSLHILESFGINFHNRKLTDVSPAHARAMLAQAKQEAMVLHEYNRESLSSDQQMSYDILDYFLKQQTDSEPFLFYDYPVNQLFGLQNELPDFMVNIHQVNSVGDAENYITRLKLFPLKFDQTIEGLKLRQGLGIVPPKFVIVRCIDGMRDFSGKKPEENVLYSSLATKLEKAGIAGDDRQRLLDACRQAISDQVYPAYQKLIDFMNQQLEVATTDDGVWKLPNGDAFYAYILRNQTTTDMTPEQVHELGLKETARIQGEMDAILKAQGMADGTVGERMTALAKDPRFQFSNDDAGRQACLEGFRKIIDEVNTGINKVFDLRPKASVVVERVPPFKEAGAPGGYYDMPALDGSRPGTFYANLRDMTEVEKYGMRTLVYHEAIPGHHFQIAIQQQLKGPTFRKMPLFTAYVEGWALYAERLAWEQGFESDPYDNLGRLQDELFRAVRLVVDTGIHYKRWTREQAIDYMVANTGMNRESVTTEIERYIVSPGQACSYKVGMMKILELRERAQKELGDKFDIKQFHNHVLKYGALPLAVLERVIDRYITDAKAQAA